MHKQADTPHQLIPGPKVHSSLIDIAIAYVNHLEERAVMFGREMAASHERELRNDRAEPGATTHPWDMRVSPDEANPLGLTARDMIAVLRIEMEAVRNEAKRLREQIAVNRDAGWGHSP
jgi:hypothetical protein